MNKIDFAKWRVLAIPTRDTDPINKNRYWFCKRIVDMLDEDEMHIIHKWHKSFTVNHLEDLAMEKLTNPHFMSTLKHIKEIINQNAIYVDSIIEYPEGVITKDRIAEIMSKRQNQLIREIYERYPV